jgi:hypothetical protein
MRHATVLASLRNIGSIVGPWVAGRNTGFAGYSHGFRGSLVIKLQWVTIKRSAAVCCIYCEQGAWPQSQAISVSSDPASLQNWLQYFSPAGGMQTQA